MTSISSWPSFLRWIFECSKKSGLSPSKPVLYQFFTIHCHFCVPYFVCCCWFFAVSLPCSLMTECNPDTSADVRIWEELEWTQPPPDSVAKGKNTINKTKSLKMRKNVTASDVTDGENFHFVSPLKDIEFYQQPYCSKNSVVSTRWALKYFEDWVPTLKCYVPRMYCWWLIRNSSVLGAKNCCVLFWVGGISCQSFYQLLSSNI